MTNIHDYFSSPWPDFYSCSTNERRENRPGVGAIDGVHDRALARKAMRHQRRRSETRRLQALDKRLTALNERASAIRAETHQKIWAAAGALSGTTTRPPRRPWWHLWKD